MTFSALSWHSYRSGDGVNHFIIKMEAMKKLLIVMLGLSISVVGMSQADGSQPGASQPVASRREKDKAMKDLKTDVRAHKAATHQVNHDLGHVRIRRAIQDHKSVASTHKMVNADSRRLKDKGVSHPVAKAKRQVRVEDDNHKDHI
jgi:hypothetical protein